VKKESALTPPMPEFKPQVPKHLVELESSGEKYLIDEVSVLRQQNVWQSEIIEEIHNRLGVINDKLLLSDDFRQYVTERFNINDKLKEQREVFEDKKTKWTKIGLYIFFIVLYPVYLVGVTETSSESIGRLLKNLF
jgi:hypothetical protein